MPDFDTSVPHIARVCVRMNRSMAEQVALRDRAGVTRLFDGLKLVEPGVIRAPEWRPASDLAAASPAVLWVGVARQP